MHDLLTVYVWFALAGGAMGALKAFYRGVNKQLEWGECVVNFCISVTSSVSITTYIFDPQVVHPFIYLGAAIPVGYLSINSLEIARAMLPSIMHFTFRLQQGAAQNADEK